MSNTRYAPPGAPLRQERYASSPALDRGLLGNLVASRCSVLDSAEDRELIWSLQSRSWLDGSLCDVADDLLRLYPQFLGTQAMHEFGMSGKHYNADQVRRIRDELDTCQPDEKFILKGELTKAEEQSKDLASDEHWTRSCRRLFDDPLGAFDSGKWERLAAARPGNYPVQAFIDECRAAAEGRLENTDKLPAAESLDKFLWKLCLDPESRFDGCWYIPGLREPLRRYHDKCVAESRAASVVTKLSRLVHETLDFALNERRLVWFDGQPGRGREFSAKHWCECHPGRARYAQVPSSNDDMGFYREIAKAIGVSINLKSKAQELRQRIEATLQGGDLLLVLGGADYLFPQCNDRHGLPVRLNWVLNALVKHSVPVALVTTPLFLQTLRAVEDRGHWNSQDFITDAHYQPLPQTLSDSDLAAVTFFLWTAGDKESIAALVNYAKVSAKYLAGIESVLARARFVAARDGRKDPTRADVKGVLKNIAIPSEGALDHAVEAADAASAKGRRKGRAVMLPARGSAPEATQRQRNSAPPDNGHVVPGGRRPEHFADVPSALIS